MPYTKCVARLVNIDSMPMGSQRGAATPRKAIALI